jgi:hypothetical protein
MMKVTRSQSKFLASALSHWRDSGALDPETSTRLLSDISVEPFDWKRLAKYSFWVAIACIIIAVGSVLADRILLDLIERIFNASAVLKCVACSAAAAALYYFGFLRRRLHPTNIFSNEAILFLGVLATAGAVYQFGSAIDTGSGHFSVLLLLSFFIYALIGYFGRSALVWIFAIASFGAWMGTETGYASGWGAYYLGMNYPLRFVVLGALLTGVALFLQGWFFERVTLIMGLLYLFIALWILSIFGNYGDMTSWSSVKQYELLPYGILFGAAAYAAIWHGLRFDNGVTKGFGLTFLFINLYTRYFEFFWDSIHKAIFFALLAISFWFIGSRAEKIWRLGESK